MDAPPRLSDAFKTKAAEMDRFGRDFLKRAQWHDHVAGVFRTSTLVYFVTGDSTLRRLGNACLFDDAARKAKPTFAAAARYDRCTTAATGVGSSRSS
jgi:hypothetical protein